MECIVENCTRTDVRPSTGYCNRHHVNWRRNGTPHSRWELLALEPKQICTVGDCDREARAGGYCNRHYENNRLRGNAIPRRDRTDLLGVIREIGWNVTEGGCWEWRGSRNDLGYGLLSHRGLGLKVARVHRLMLEISQGPFAADLHVRHKCDNPPCINPDHLETGTHADNMNDVALRERSGTSTKSRGGFCPNGHDLRLPGTTKTVHRKGRKPSTECVACARERSRRYEAKARSPKKG